MSFFEHLQALDIDRLRARCRSAAAADVEQALRDERGGFEFGMERLVALLSPAAAGRLESLAERSHALAVRRFGRTIQLYAPLYLSNVCVNICHYCGFSVTNRIPRRTLTSEEAARECRHLVGRGFAHVLLVSGEHPREVSVDYLDEVVRRLHPMVASLSIEVQPFEEAEYRRLARSGVDGLVVYQETYDPPLYARMHPKGYKRDYRYRLEALERGYRAGMRRLGIGILLGLGDWRRDALVLGAHAAYLFKHGWQAHLTISLPRLRPAAGGFEPLQPVTDQELVQMICALRLVFPDVGLVLSTREAPEFRDGLMRLGVTQMSAGSRTEPGGYGHPGEELEQFAIEDRRSPAEVARSIRRAGYDPVWKDWERILHAAG
jgi:2-iminoacetate synthase